MHASTRTGPRAIQSSARCCSITPTHKGYIVTYFKTIAQAQALADQLNYSDADGWTYRVYASSGGFYVAIFDDDFNHVGNL
jgi:hypothetical protein